MTTVDITLEQIKLGRVRRKLEKALKQRDHYKERLGYYEKVISMQPYLETRYKSYLEMKSERERVKQLEARVKEQAALIKLLQQDRGELK